MKLRLVLDVEYDLNGVPVEELRANLEGVVTHAMGLGLITGGTAAEVKTHEYVIRERPPVVLTETLDGPGDGFIVAIDTVAEGLTVSVREEGGKPVVFATQEAAEKCILELLADRVDECQRGERDFDDATTIEEFVKPVTVDAVGVIYDEDDYEFWAPTELE